MKPTVGVWLTLAHHSIAEIFCNAGFDWVCIDLEHSVIDWNEAQSLLSVIQARGLKSYVRVAKNDSADIRRALDAGCNGVIVPLVNSVADAKRALEAAKYPPQGIRGAGLARAQNYGPGFLEYFNSANQKTEVILQVEHKDAIENLEAILDLEGVSATLVGPYDLSASMGCPGDFTNPKVLGALQRYEAVSKKKKVPMGFHVVEPNPEILFQKIQSGYSFLGFSLDTVLLDTMVRRSLEQVSKMVQR